MSSLDKANVILARFKRHGIEPGTNYATVYDALLAMLDVADNAYNAGRAYQREVDAIKVVEYFKPLRFDDCHHLGFGDVRITIGQVEELAESIREQKIDD